MTNRAGDAGHGGPGGAAGDGGSGSAADGLPGESRGGDAGAAGAGGGIRVAADSVLERIAVTGNLTGAGGDGGSAGTGGAGGGSVGGAASDGGSGSGISAAAALELVNATVAENESGPGGSGRAPGSMAIESSFGHATISHATIANNPAGGVGGTGEGSVEISNSIVVSLSGPSCEASNTDFDGHNLVHPAGLSCGGDVQGAPRLGGCSATTAVPPGRWR